MKGKTSSNISSYTDECIIYGSGSVVSNCSSSNCLLREYYCDLKDSPDYIVSYGYNCPSGCNDGACLPQPNATTPYVTVLLPNGGEKWEIGSTQTIRWNSILPDSAVISVQLIKNGKAVYRFDKPFSNSLIKWHIEPISKFGELVPGDDYKIRVNIDATPDDNIMGDNTIVGDSNFPFSIISLISPDSGTCTDSDVGNDPFLKGNVIINRTGYEGNGIHYDFCVDNQVTQRDCTFTDRLYYLQNTGFYDCPNGCDNGVCIKEEGFQYAYWKCQNGEEQKQGSDSSCKSSETWQNYALKFCENKCSVDKEGNEKCGVNYFSVSGECFDKEDEEPKLNVSELPGNISLVCKSSCPFDDSCLPIGYRQKGEFCSGKGILKSQLGDKEICDNNFECESNVCVSGQCVEVSLIQKILQWFRNLFS